MVRKKMYILIAFLVLLSSTSGEFKAKSSIAFVIDNTDSMVHEIKQVKNSAANIFEAVRSSNASQIDEFIIITFNDPGAKVEVKTNRYSTFKGALGRIKVFGGDECPEMAMKGIKKALNASKPNSLLYAFTDASAKDYKKYEEVKSLALEKSIQITFLLTGECKNDTIEQRTVYDRLAAATLGQVFHIEELEIGKIIEYVLANIRSTRTILLRKTYRNRCDHYKFTVDSKVWDILIALSAPTPLLNLDLIVLGPDGNKASTSDFINSNKTTIFKLEGNPGEYSISITNCEGITVLVSAATSVSFRHGFSSATPSSLDETSTKPLLGKKSYLAIALDNDERDVTLKTLEIRDMDDKLVQQLSLKLVDKENQFYITDLFTPPEKAHEIAINGYTKSNEKITRLSPTCTEYHRPEIPAERPAVATVIGPNEVFAEFNQSVKLKCKVDGFPRPQISWSDEFHKVWQAKVTQISPHEYISDLYIDKVTMNVTFTCTAENSEKNSDYVSVIVEKKSFIDVLEYPKDVTVDYGKPVELNFKINVRPPATILWYQGNKIITNNEDIIISSDGSTLNIKSAKPSLEGDYYVTASNGNDKKKYEFKIIVTMKEKPAKVTTLDEVFAEYNQPLTLTCKVEGYPEPSITWENEYHNVMASMVTEKTSPYEFINTLQIDKATDNATYVCKAKNKFSEDSDSVKVVVKNKPFLKVLEYPKDVTVENGKSVELKLKIDAFPPPTIIWYQDDKEIRNNHDFDISVDGSLLKIMNVQPRLQGKYFVQATGGDKKVKKYEFNVTVMETDPPKVTLNPSPSLQSEKGEEVKLICKVSGFPIPTVRWLVDEVEIHSGTKYKILNHTLSFTGEIRDSGNYFCEASNYLKTVRAEVSVLIYDPIKIETPKQIEFEAKLRSTLILPCHVTGYPIPTVIWLLNNHGLTYEPNQTGSVEDNSIILQNIQPENEGFYTCRAINKFNRKEIKYTVKVPVPVTIISNLGTRNIELIEGDLYFNLSCNAMGSPKPIITWTLNGTKVGRDEGFEILDEGTLTGSNVTLSHKGTYSCKAENKHSNATMEYEVDVHKFPPILENPEVLPIREGWKIYDILCGIQKVEEGDSARWFKDGKFINTGDIHKLVNVTKADAGFYTCRLSKPQGPSYTFHKRVSVGSAPKFLTDANPRVAFKAGAKAHLDCSATGDPPPTTKWWNDTSRINVDATQYTFIMNASNIGQYMCSVSNEFDTIKRYFTVTSDEECLMDLKKDFTAQQPLLLTYDAGRKRPFFKTSGGFLRMPKYKKYKFFCPGSFISYNNHNYGNNLGISCVGDSMFELRGRHVKASEITCDKAIIPLAETEIGDNNKPKTCLGLDTQLLHIGFDVDQSLVYVFDVCFNEMTKTPIFVNNAMHRAIANILPEHVAYYTSGTHLQFQFEEIYDCRNQWDAISLFTSKSLKNVEDEKCCFKRLQLLNPKDVLPGISQVATYHYLNVVPQWNTCGTENWDEVERRVRDYAFNLEGRLAIWTGAASIVTNVAQITLKDKLNQELQVPQFIWKVIEDILAIIHINVPGLTPQQVSTYILCEDICEAVGWMNSTQWHDINRGYIYCCNVKKFEEVFGYENIFGKYPV